MQKLKADHQALALALYLAASAPDDEREAQAVSRAKRLAELLTPDEVQRGVVLAVELIADDPHGLMAAKTERAG